MCITMALTIAYISNPQFNRLPQKPNRIVSLQESVTLTGLGCQPFDQAVRAIKAIHQLFEKDIDRRGLRLRPWTPANHAGMLTLSFTNRYLTSGRDAIGETSLNLGDVVDPFNVLRPLLKDRSEVHVGENVVEHWERSVKDNQTGGYVVYVICLGSMLIYLYL